MDANIVRRFKDLQRQYAQEVSKRWPSWAKLQQLRMDYNDLVLTYPELLEIDSEPNR